MYFDFEILIFFSVHKKKTQTQIINTNIERIKKK